MKHESNNAPLPQISGTENTETWTESLNWSLGQSGDSDSVSHGKTLSALALMYLHHDDAPRALVLALTAFAMGDTSPSTALLLAKALLKAGDPAQVLAVLSRFDGDASTLSRAPTETEIAAKSYIAALAHFRLGDKDLAKAEMERMRTIEEDIKP